MWHFAPPLISADTIWQTRCHPHAQRWLPGPQVVHRQGWPQDSHHRRSWAELTWSKGWRLRPENTPLPLTANPTEWLRWYQCRTGHRESVSRHEWHPALCGQWIPLPNRGCRPLDRQSLPARRRLPPAWCPRQCNR